MLIDLCVCAYVRACVHVCLCHVSMSIRMHFRDKIMLGLALVILLSKPPGHVDCRHVLPKSVVTAGSFTHSPNF